MASSCHWAPAAQVKTSGWASSSPPHSYIDKSSQFHCLNGSQIWPFSPTPLHCFSSRNHHLSSGLQQQCPDSLLLLKSEYTDSLQSAVHFPTLLLITLAWLPMPYRMKSKPFKKSCLPVVTQPPTTLRWLIILANLAKHYSRCCFESIHGYN